MAGGAPLGSSNPDRLTRRTFVLLLVGGALGPVLLHRGVHTLAWESIIRPEFPLDDSSIRELGASCAKMLDHCSTFSELVRHLRPCPAITWVADGARSSIGQRRVRERLGRLVADEYAAGRTLIADGWVLSHTEAAFCAAASIKARHAHT